jgi:hypothetical protein
MAATVQPEHWVCLQESPLLMSTALLLLDRGAGRCLHALLLLLAGY